MSRSRFATQTRWQRIPVPSAAGGLGTPLLIIEGGATLRGIRIADRSVLLPLSEDGIAINYVMGGRRQLIRCSREKATWRRKLRFKS